MKIERWTSILICGLPIIWKMAKMGLILIYLISWVVFVDFGFTAIFFWTLLRNNFVVDKKSTWSKYICTMKLVFINIQGFVLRFKKWAIFWSVVKHEIPKKFGIIEILLKIIPTTMNFETEECIYISIISSLSEFNEK